MLSTVRPLTLDYTGVDSTHREPLSPAQTQDNPQALQTIRGHTGDEDCTVVAELLSWLVGVGLLADVVLLVILLREQLLQVDIVCLQRCQEQTPVRRLRIRP